MIQATEMTKTYDHRDVVRDVSFTCEPGTVTGFLGPNGAGKSSTMRMLCGFTRPDTGRACVAGAEFHALANPGRTVGVLLDATAQHDGRRGRQTLAHAAQTIGMPRRRVDEMLELVGLEGPAGRQRVRNYSLGMRQRLGLAHALIGDPHVLILDEPANGLDPDGMRWMRALLRGFADRGGTVLLSSHLLHEVEAIADHLLIIRDGHLVADLDRAARRGAIVDGGTSRGQRSPRRRAPPSRHRDPARQRSHVDHRCLPRACRRRGDVR